MVSSSLTACHGLNSGRAKRATSQAGGTRSANHTALPETFQLPSRPRVRWAPHSPADSPSTTCRPRPFTPSLDRTFASGRLPVFHPGCESNTLHTSSQREPAPRTYSHSSGKPLTGRWLAPLNSTLPCACSVLAASSLAMVTPSWTRSPGSPIPATASRKKLLAVPAHVGSSGSARAKQPPARTLASALDPAESNASTTGAAIRPLSAAEWPPAPRRSGPLSAGDGSMLLRLSDSDICETQIMSRVRAYAMVTGEKPPAIGRFHRRGSPPPMAGHLRGV